MVYAESPCTISGIRQEDGWNSKFSLKIESNQVVGFFPFQNYFFGFSFLAKTTVVAYFYQQMGAEHYIYWS